MLKKQNGMPLIAAHRGACGGNIPCNTIASFDAAIAQGADIIELDVSQSSDGKLFVFHPGMEKPHLNCEKLLSELTASEIEKLRYMNFDSVYTQFGISRLEEVLEHLKGRCIVNIDKFWDNIEPVTKLIRELGMQEQVLVKTGPVKEQIDLIEKTASDIPYMLVIRHNDEITDEMLKRPLNYVGVEALFSEDTEPIAAKEYIDKMHKKNLIVWGNAIVYDINDVIAGGHNDDISAAGNPDGGWGWLIDRGYDIIQTDWIMMLKAYMESR